MKLRTAYTLIGLFQDSLLMLNSYSAMHNSYSAMLNSSLTDTQQCLTAIGHSELFSTSRHNRMFLAICNYLALVSTCLLVWLHMGLLMWGVYTWLRVKAMLWRGLVAMEIDELIDKLVADEGTTAPDQIGTKVPDKSQDVIGVTKNTTVTQSHSRPAHRAVGLEEPIIEPDSEVRYLYASSPGEHELEGGLRRATDPVWSLTVHSVQNVVRRPNQPAIYYLDDGPARGFVREELMIVPPDTVLPPDRILTRQRAR